MNQKREKDEHLEKLWNMKEKHIDSIDHLKDVLGKDFNNEIVKELSSEGLVEMKEDGRKLVLTKKGEDVTRQLIRAHRLAERMIYDVMGGDFERGACEFEHIITPELIDSICILLGHPKECPHGMPIPQGECCKSLAKVAHSSVAPLIDLQVGERARVAYVNCKNDQELHKIDGLHIRPGAIIKLHQTYPSYVIECEGANIALDREIASNICIWKQPDHLKINAKKTSRQCVEKKGWGCLGLRLRRGKGPR